MNFIKRMCKGIGFAIVVFLGFLAYFFVDYIEYKDNAAPILMYHGVGEEDGTDWGDMLINPKYFEQQLEYLTERGYKIVSVEELAERFRTNKSVAKYIAFTFDDGYANNYYYAFPLLKKYNATATFFLVYNAINTAGYMTDVQLYDMLWSGMCIGSHTLSHPNLLTVGSDNFKRELAGSKMLLGQCFEEVIVESLSYPNGLYNDEIVQATADAGYKEGVTGIMGVNTYESFAKAPFLMYRVGVYDRGKGIDGFARMLEKAYFTGYLSNKGLDLAKIRSFFR